MATTARVGDFSLIWGESLRWDDRRHRLYFVDCGTQTLHWLDRAEPPLQSLKLPGMPAGVVLTENNTLVAALDDGLHVIEPDEGTSELLSPYPAGLGGRANDAHADLDGNLVTGTLNLQTAPGSYWWFSSANGWRQLDDGISNSNGPVVLDLEGTRSLVIADTPAGVLYAYDYDGASGRVSNRRTFANIADRGGMPDGACADDENGVWSCVLGAGTIARYTAQGFTGEIQAGVELPSDVTFGGPDMDRMFVVSIAVPIADVEIKSEYAGAILAIDGTGFRGRPEPRFRL